jgi:hypothetical protein
MNYCGIDLHSNNCVVIVSDDNDRIVGVVRKALFLGDTDEGHHPAR